MLRNVFLGSLLRLFSRRWDHSQFGSGGGSERPPGLPSLVDTKAIGKPPTFNGDFDVTGQPEGMPWSQVECSDPTATRLLRQVESNVEDLVIVDNTSMTEAERRLSMQLFYVLALTCRGKALQVVRRVPEEFGFEAWNSCAESLSPSSVTIPRNASSYLVANENGRSRADNVSMGEQGFGLRGTVR